ncbi:MAG TPA: MBL fold metallo-hydrolase [Clostridia bacterium]
MYIFPEIKGSITDYDVLVTGHLKWNRYFGETPQSPPRGDPSTCSSVLIRGKQADGSEYVLIVDPTVRWTPEAYYFDINRRTGLKPDRVTHLFCTHHHADHYEAFKYFPNAIWMAAEPVAGLLRENKLVDGSKIVPVAGEFLPGVYALPLPGHTDTLHGIAFSAEGKNLLVAADAVMTKYHYQNNTTEFQPDPEMNAVAARTIENIKESFDMVIPGHDQLIVNWR